MGGSAVVGRAGATVNFPVSGCRRADGPKPTHNPHLLDLLVSDARLSPFRGIYASISAFLVFSMVQFRDGPFVRPHPAFWRIILGINLLYELGLVYMLFEDLPTARKFLQMLDSSLNKPLPEKNYAEDCSFTFT